MVAAALGWIGTAGTLLAYLSLSRGWLPSTSRRYAALNIVGGVLAGAACALYGAWPSAASNFIWAAIGMMSVAAAVRGGIRRSLQSVQSCPAPGELAVH
jgi:hypothetical protein